jgi:anti-sigma factor RsiW
MRSDAEMTHNFHSHNDHSQPAPTGPQNAASSMETLQRDRFELLSAYIDGEVTAAERKQVEAWLATDPTMRRLHSQLLRLHHGFQNLPDPAPEQSVEQTVEQVLARVDRRPNLRLVWGGAAVAALVVGGIATVFSGDRAPLFQTAQESNQEQVQASGSNTADSEPLLIALDRPLVAIPKAPVAQPTDQNANVTQPIAEPAAQ